MQRYSSPLVDKLMSLSKAKDDHELAEWLEVSGSSVSRMRNSPESITANMILHIYDMTFLTIEEIRELIKQSPKELDP